MFFFRKFPVSSNSSDPEGMLKDNSVGLAETNPSYQLQAAKEYC